jgi:hypothetical protein
MRRFIARGKPQGLRSVSRAARSKGWEIIGGVRRATIAGREEGRIRPRAVAPQRLASSRQVVGISATADGRSFGELSEAIVDFPNDPH